MPVIAPEEPQLALARGAALASANAPRYDTSTIGLAYSQDPDGTTVYPLALADDATAFLGPADASTDAADIASDPDDVPERRKPFLLVGSSLTAIFVAGMMALTIAMVVNVRPTADQGSDDIRFSRALRRRPPLCRVRRPPRAAAAARRSPSRSGGPTTCAPRHGTAEGSARPAPPRVVVRNAAPAPARRHRTGPTPARCGSAGDTAADHPVPGTCLPRFFSHRPTGSNPPWYPGPSWPRPGHGGSRPRPRWRPRD